jgi:phage gp36-like protein
MWKKFSALFVLSVFLLSMVPLAFAEDTEETNETEVVAEETETAVESDTSTASEAATEDVEPTPRGKLKERRQEIKAKIVEAKAQVVAARQHYVEVKQTYLSERQKFLEARQEYLDCDDLTTEECKAKRDELKGKARPYLLNIADLVLGELDRIKEKVQSSEELSDEEKSEITSDLDARIEEVTEAKSVIENLDNESTREDVNAAAKTIREAWRNTRVSLKKDTGRLVNAKLGNIIEKTESLEAKLTKVRDRLEEKGADVSVLDEKLDDFSAKIDSARENYEAAVQAFKDAHTVQEVNDAVKEVHQYITDAKAALKDARDFLREAVNEIKRLNKGSLEVEAEEEEAEEQEEQEAEETEEQEAEEVEEETGEGTGVEEETAEESEEEAAETA